MNTTVENILEIRVDEGRLKAFIRPTPGVDPRSISASALASELQAAKISLNESVQGRMKEFLDQLTSSKGRMKPFLIAEAQLPVEAKDGDYQWDRSDRPIAAMTPMLAVESRIKQSDRIVARDEMVGRVIPSVDGVAGLNVFDEVLPPQTAKGNDIRLDESVRLDSDGFTLIANRSGRVVYDEGRVAVHDVLQIERDIKPRTEKLDWDLDVIIRGSVGDSATIASTQSIIVKESILSAEVRGNGCIFAHFGIIGQGKGRINAGRDVVAKFCEDGDIHAGRDVYIGTNAVNSRIVAGGHVLAPRATIIGGEIRAQHCVEAQVLGSEGAVATDISVGASVEVIQKVKLFADEIRKHSEKLEKIQAALIPMQENLKRLDPSQKEQLTELSFDASALEAEIDQATEKRTEWQNQINNDACVKIHSMIHEGVRVTIGDRFVEFNQPMQGPIRIMRRKINNATELVTVHETNDQVVVLKSKRIGLDT